MTEREIPFLRGYPVFNADRIEGLPAHFHPQPVAGAGEGRDDRTETFIRNTGAVIRHQGEQPLYS
jgi:antirestriction protein ArdC